MSKSAKEQIIEAGGTWIEDTDGIEAVQIDLAERVQVLEDKVAQFEEAIMGAMQHPMMSQVLRMMGVDPTKATPADLLKG